MKKIVSSTVFFLLSLPFITAQDLHFSQYDQAIGLTRPSMVGGYIDNTYQRVNVSYRNQWQTVPVAYNSVLGTWDRAFRVKKLKNGHFGGGVALLHDAAGDSRLGLTQVNLMGAYHQQLTKTQLLSFGISLGYGLRQFSPKNLRFDSQYNSDVLDTNLPTQENFGTTNFGFFDSGASLAWQYFKGRNQVWIGATLAHLHEPVQSFLPTGGEKLPRRYTFFGGGQFPLSPKSDLMVSAQLALQGKYQELLGTIVYDFHLNENRFKKTNLLIGVAYRNQDAVIPMVGLRYNAWRVMLSYDANISAFTAASRTVGGPEITVQHAWFKIIPNPKNKACPVY